MDQNQAVAGQNRITGTPTLFLYKGGRFVDGIVGAVPKTELQTRLDSFLKA